MKFTVQSTLRNIKTSSGAVVLIHGQFKIEINHCSKETYTKHNLLCCFVLGRYFMLTIQTYLLIGGDCLGVWRFVEAAMETGQKSGCPASFQEQTCTFCPPVQWF